MSQHTHHMQQQCQDALAINYYFGGDNLFITMIANASWPEIQNTLHDGQAAHDRPDLVVCIFHAKLHFLDGHNNALQVINFITNITPNLAIPQTVRNMLKENSFHFAIFNSKSDYVV